MSQTVVFSGCLVKWVIREEGQPDKPGETHLEARGATGFDPGGMLGTTAPAGVHPDMLYEWVAAFLAQAALVIAKRGTVEQLNRLRAEAAAQAVDEAPVSASS